MWRREGERAHYIDGASEPYNRGHEARRLRVGASRAHSWSVQYREAGAAFLGVPSGAGASRERSKVVTIARTDEGVNVPRPFLSSYPNSDGDADANHPRDDEHEPKPITPIPAGLK